MAENDISNIFTEEPKPRNLFRIYCVVLFVMAWLTVLGTGIYNMRVFRRGSPIPTGSQTEPLTQHGLKVYVTQEESDEIRWLNTVAWIGDGTAIVVGFVLAYFHIFPPRRKRKRKV